MIVTSTFAHPSAALAATEASASPQTSASVCHQLTSTPNDRTPASHPSATQPAPTPTATPTTLASAKKTSHRITPRIASNANKGILQTRTSTVSLSANSLASMAHVLAQIPAPVSMALNQRTVPFVNRSVIVSMLSVLLLILVPVSRAMCPSIGLPVLRSVVTVPMVIVLLQIPVPVTVVMLKLKVFVNLSVPAVLTVCAQLRTCVRVRMAL